MKNTAKLLVGTLDSMTADGIQLRCPWNKLNEFDEILALKKFDSMAALFGVDGKDAVTC